MKVENDSNSSNDQEEENVNSPDEFLEEEEDEFLEEEEDEFLEEEDITLDLDEPIGVVPTLPIQKKMAARLLVGSNYRRSFCSQHWCLFCLSVYFRL